MIKHDFKADFLEKCEQLAESLREAGYSITSADPVTLLTALLDNRIGILHFLRGALYAGEVEILKNDRIKPALENSEAGPDPVLETIRKALMGLPDISLKDILDFFPDDKIYDRDKKILVQNLVQIVPLKILADQLAGLLKNFSEGSDRFELLAALWPVLSDQDPDALSQNLADILETLPEGEKRIQEANAILVVLASYAPEESSKNLADILETFPKGEERVKAANEILPILADQAPEVLLQNLADILQTLPEGEDRVNALKAIIPILNGEHAINLFKNLAGILETFPEDEARVSVATEAFSALPLGACLFLMEEFIDVLGTLPEDRRAIALGDKLSDMARHNASHLNNVHFPGILETLPEGAVRSRVAENALSIVLIDREAASHFVTVYIGNVFNVLTASPGLSQELLGKLRKYNEFVRVRGGDLEFTLNAYEAQVRPPEAAGALVANIFSAPAFRM